MVLLAGCDVRVVPVEPTASNVTVPVPGARGCEDGVRFAVVAGDSAMGLRVVDFEVVNCGTAPYRVSGYPGIRLFDAGRRPVAVSVEHGGGSIATIPDNPPADFTLRPGERARSGVVWRNLVTDSATAVTAAYLEVTTGEGAPWRDVPLAGDTIDLGNTGKIGVRAWVRA